MPDDRSVAALAERFCHVRRHSVTLCEPLAVEDYQLQSMPDASPPKWHLAHTTWFFETFLLEPYARTYQPHHPQFSYLFNSYYDAVGARHPRPARGLLSRPTVAEVREYRRAVDAAVCEWFAGQAELPPDVVNVVELGLAHEEQHQELLVTDLLHAFFQNPLLPAYRTPDLPAENLGPARWQRGSGGVVEIGHTGGGFAFDNESPQHRVYLAPFAMQDRLTTVAEYQEFIADGGYDRPELWLADGWAARQRHGWTAPLYWHPRGESNAAFTLAGVQPLDPNAAVTNISFYEADAFTRWAGVRLPTEPEWETAARTLPLRQVDDIGWQWTASPYTAYPGYRPAAGALGEYNGKFMCNQMVLRGASRVTPTGHSRRTYRNFFPPETRWQFTSIRPTRDG